MLVKQRLKLIDFGIAKRIASNTTNISRESSVGTISYMAPEAVKQGAVKIGRPSDVWSLGIILCPGPGRGQGDVLVTYQMIYMRAPFAHLDPMQRLFALTAWVAQTACWRNLGHPDFSEAEILDWM
ncbi:Serine/threonine-protein kinase mph1 [Durusdinium trenchii]|uniref:Serine/threonine-protein kinase mph1 n=1 Tax=Durusdinium trenchii TaxID=1381693 RepID=A0ABP0RLC3_9DINO